MRVILFMLLTLGISYAALPPLKLKPSYQNTTCMKGVVIKDDRDIVIIKKNKKKFIFDKKQEVYDDFFIYVREYQVDCYTKDILKISYVFEDEKKYLRNNVFYNFNTFKSYKSLTLKILDIPNKYKKRYIIGYSVFDVHVHSPGIFIIFDFKKQKKIIWDGYTESSKKVSTKSLGKIPASELTWRLSWDGLDGSDKVIFKNGRLSFIISEFESIMPDEKITIDLNTVCEKPPELITTTIQCYDIK